MQTETVERNCNLTLIIQHIFIWWSKASRGGELAEKRNKIPRVLPLPTPPPTYDRGKHYIVHKIAFAEHNQFLAPWHETVKAPRIETSFTAMNCRVETNGDSPIVKFQWRDGAPTRVHAAALPIPQQEWVQVEYNARYSSRDSGMWSYQHEIFNVALGHPENLDIFVTSKPSTIHQDLAYLW